MRMNELKLPNCIKVPPRVRATFVKQEWSGNKKGCAVPVGEERIDVTDRLLRLPADSIRSLSDDTYESDALVEGRHDHDGPFAVKVVEELDAFLEIFGIDTPGLTDDHLSQLRGIYRVDPAGPESIDLLWHTVLCNRQDTYAAGNVDYSIREMLKALFGSNLIVTSVISQKYNETGLIFTYVPVTDAQATELYDAARDEEIGEVDLAA